MNTFIILAIGTLLVPQGPNKPTLVGDTLILNNGSAVRMGITAQDMESLIYGLEALPGLSPHRVGDMKVHTSITLNSLMDSGAYQLQSEIARQWRDEKAGVRVRIDLKVYDKAIDAESWVTSFIRGSSSALMKRNSAEGRKLGNASCTNSLKTGTSIHVAMGRAVFTVWATAPGPGKSMPDSLAEMGAAKTAEALAYGLVHELSRRPEIAGGESLSRKFGQTWLGPADGLGSISSTLTLSLPALQKLGLTSKWKGMNIELGFGGKTAKTRLFSSELEIDGKKESMSMPVVLGFSGPVVPVLKVLRALGVPGQGN